MKKVSFNLAMQCLNYTQYTYICTHKGVHRFVKAHTMQIFDILLIYYKDYILYVFIFSIKALLICMQYRNITFEGSNRRNCQISTNRCVHMYSSTALHMYRCTALHMYRCTDIHMCKVYSFTYVQVYICTGYCRSVSSL